MPSVVKQTWSDSVSVIAVWAVLVFVLMFYHRSVGIQSEWLPQIVFGSFVVLAFLAPIGSLAWRHFRRSA